MRSTAGASRSRRVEKASEWLRRPERRQVAGKVELVGVAEARVAAFAEPEVDRIASAQPDPWGRHASLGQVAR